MEAKRGNRQIPAAQSHLWISRTAVNRTLAYLDKADGWDYSVEAARAGMAHSYIYHNHPSARADEIAAAETEAKAAGRGLWGPPCYGQTASVPN
nr:thermonuclease family protein [Mycobacterium sp. JS623]